MARCIWPCAYLHSLPCDTVQRDREGRSGRARERERESEREREETETETETEKDRAAGQEGETVNEKQMKGQARLCNET